MSRGQTTGRLATNRTAGMIERGYADSSPFEFTRKISNVVFDINPHLAEEDRQAIHEHEPHTALAHGIGA